MEGDLVAHGFELGDEAPLPAGGVAVLVEVVAAQVVVGLAVVTRCQAITRIEWPTATAARCGPRRPRIWTYWAAR